MESPTLIGAGVTDQETDKGKTTVALQPAGTVWPPEVTATVAFFVPVIEYTRETEEPEPDKPFVPVHEYV
jgi:hypothetical protein